MRKIETGFSANNQGQLTWGSPCASADRGGLIDADVETQKATTERARRKPMPLQTLKLILAVAAASAVVVRDAAEFQAELARGAPSIHLAAEIYLEGEELNVTAPCVIAVGVVAGVGLLVFLGSRWRSLAKKKRKLQAERTLIVSEQVTAARERVQEFQAHFVTVPGSVFLGFDRLRPQEELRDEIIVYDSVADVRDASTRGEVFIFFSHQWL